MPKNKHLVKYGLSPKMQRFCEEYIKDLNGTQAAIRSGYSEKGASVRGSELLAKSNIQNRIAELARDVTSRNGVTSQRILTELAMLGFSKINDYVEIEEGGAVRIKRFDEIPDDKIGAIRKIKDDRIIHEKADGSETIIIHDKLSFELHDKIRPLIKLGEVTGLFETELPDGDVPQMVHNEFKIMIMNVNGDKIKEIDLSKMIDVGKRQANG